MGLLKPSIVDFGGIGLIAVMLHVIITMIIIMGYKSKEKFVFLLAFLSRVLFMLWDLYARGIFILPNSGADSEMYYEASLRIANNLSLLGTTRGGMFANIMGLLFHFIGPQRIIGQYVNVLIGLSVVLIIYKLLIMMNINKSTIKGTLLITSFFPNSIIMSAIFLREIIPTFFVTASLYYFIKWVKYQKILSAMLTLVMLSIASIFHSGVIGCVIGYFFGFLFYNRNNNKLKFSTNSIIVFVMILAVIILSFTYFEDLLFGKFRNLEDISDIYNNANRSLGGSAYLTSLAINNPLQLVIFGPIKSFYFLTAPLPMNWRGIMDVFTFLTDSMLYLITILYVMKNRKFYGENKVYITCIIWAIVGASLIFGIGVGNAGTAVRHRQKLVSLFLVLLGIVMDSKKKYVNKLKT